MGDEQESRRSRRESVFRGAMIRLPGADAMLPARVRDVSDGGARIDLVAGLQTEMSIEIAIGGKPPVPATVAWVADGKCGIVFDRAGAPAAGAVATCPDAAPTEGWIADMSDRYRR